MKLHEEFKLFEEMWEDPTELKEADFIKDDGCVHIDCNKLSESVMDKLANAADHVTLAGLDVILINCLKIIKRVDSTKAIAELVKMLEKNKRDSFGKLEEAPFYFNKYKVASMMADDLDRLSFSAWHKKWLIDFILNGDLQINPADYPDINLSALVKLDSGHHEF